MRVGKNGMNILDTWIFIYLKDTESHVSRKKGWQNQKKSWSSVGPSKKLRTQEFNEGLRLLTCLTNGRDMWATCIQVPVLCLPPTRGWEARSTEVLVPTPQWLQRRISKISSELQVPNQALKMPRSHELRALLSLCQKICRECWPTFLHFHLQENTMKLVSTTLARARPKIRAGSTSSKLRKETRRTPFP